MPDVSTQTHLPQAPDIDTSTFNKNNAVLNVNAEIVTLIDLTIDYINGKTANIVLSKGLIVDVTYISDGRLVQRSGKIEKISINTEGKVMIILDCSKSYSSDLAYVVVDNIRDISIQKEETEHVCNCKPVTWEKI